MKKHTYLTYIIFLFSCFTINAAPASKTIRTEILSDGSSISYYVKGDEKYHYFISEDGYTLLKNENGAFTYAEKDKNDFLVPGNIIAHDETFRTQEEILYLKNKAYFLTYNPVQISQFLEDKKPALKAKSFSTFSGNTNPDALKHSRNVVILVQFADVKFTDNDANAKFNAFCNEQGYNYNQSTGSVRDYFAESSSGAFQPSFDVYGPYTLTNPLSNYVSANFSKERNMVKEVCNLADNDVNFSQYTIDGTEVDGICIIFAGGNAAEGVSGTIWPHTDYLENKLTKFDGKIIYNYMCSSEKNYTGTMAGIGTFTHEFSHLLGLPDMYNTNNPNEFILANWDVMDGGFYNNTGRTPPSYSSYERYFMGWIEPEFLNELKNNIELPDLISSNKAFILAGETPNLNGFSPSPNEFFLLENRQQVSFDSYLSYHGMLVWHINYNTSSWNNNAPNNNTPKGIIIVPADNILTAGTKQGDPFPGNTGRTYYSPVFWDDSNLNTTLWHIAEYNKIITFDYIEGIHLGLNPMKTNENLKFWTSNNTLFVSGIEKKAVLEIMQIDGRIIKQETVKESGFEAYIPKAGIYILRLKASDSEVYSSKFVIF